MHTTHAPYTHTQAAWTRALLAFATKAGGGGGGGACGEYYILQIITHIANYALRAFPFPSTCTQPGSSRSPSWFVEHLHAARSARPACRAARDAADAARAACAAARWLTVRNTHHRGTAPPASSCSLWSCILGVCVV